ncbi:amidohydrolase [Puteibacter caeruleilacunae]|nr:amidohydrolase [Puteibacter caeruleilacunae]
MNIHSRIKELSEEYFNEALAIRRHIHQHPELSFQEFETSKYIQSKLEEYGIPFKAGFVKTGILGRIEGKKGPGKTIALRADMDALPIQETNDIPFCSVNNGVMHACGHDIHSAGLLATAKILKTLEDEIEGTILLVFQPAEESHPGGAKLMLEEGLFEDQEPDMMMALHVLPEMPAGTVGFKSGMYMASGDEIHFKIKGQGGHGALPHKVTDTVLATAQVITSLQQVVSRNAPPAIPSVLSFGKVIADGATNIIPNEVTVAGTFRTMNEEWRAKAKKRMETIATSVAEAHDTNCEFKVLHGYPVLYNDEKVTSIARTEASNLLGEDKVVDMDIRMTCEDFAYYSLKYPVTFFRLGVKSPEATKSSALHTPTFMADEQALKTAMQTLSAITLKLLQ